MKWYKHISDSLDDPFIFDLMSKYGSDGYVVFFGTLEIYSREFKPENGWKLVVSWSYFHQKLRISQSKVKKILSEISKWTVTDNGSTVSVFIPKFTELLDEWTQRKIGKTRELLGSESGQAPEILRDKKELDTDKEEELPPTPKSESCSHKEIITAYNEILCPPMRPVKLNVWGGAREKTLRARVKEDEKRKKIEWWQGLFNHITTCPFLMSKIKPPDGKKQFVGELEWIINFNNLAKIIEGKYDDEKGPGRKFNPGNGSGKPRVLDGEPPGAGEGKESHSGPAPPHGGQGVAADVLPLADDGRGRHGEAEKGT
jgi:hypothetical protein